MKLKNCFTADKLLASSLLHLDQSYRNVTTLRLPGNSKLVLKTSVMGLKTSVMIRSEKIANTGRGIRRTLIIKFFRPG